MTTPTAIPIARPLLEEVRELYGVPPRRLVLIWSKAGEFPSMMGRRRLFSACTRDAANDYRSCPVQVIHDDAGADCELATPAEVLRKAMVQETRIPSTPYDISPTWEGLEPFASWQTVMGLRWGEYGPEDLVYVDLATGKEVSP